jgi:hypothetical protein
MSSLAATPFFTFLGGVDEGSFGCTGFIFAQSPGQTVALFFRVDESWVLSR